MFGRLVLVLGLVLGLVFGERPQLKSATYQERADNFMGSDYERIESAFEFDQDLYVNEPYLCIHAEDSCPELDCVPCDWSHPESTSCWDENCCQPANHPVEQKGLWCANESNTDHSFTRLEVNKPSEVFKLDKDERGHFRFFIGAENYCTPVMVSVRSIYGNHQFFLSPVFPESDYSLVYSSTSVVYRQNQWSFSQSVFNICPGTSIYTPGTWSISMIAFEPTAFYFEITSSPSSFPLSPPEEKVMCDDVPDEVYEVSRNAGREILCLEDGVTTNFDSTQTGFDDLFDLVLPIPAGCHGVSLAVQNYVSAFIDHDINCVRLLDDQTIEYWTDYNSALASWRSTDDYISFFGCFPETTYVHCSVLPWEVGPAGIIFSTVSPFLRSSIETLPPSVLTSQIGVGSMSVVRPDVLCCGDFHLWCPSWISSGSPLVFWPPPDISSIVPRHYEPLPTEFLPSQENSGRKLFFVDATLRADSQFGSRKDQLSESVILFLSITNADGLPVEIPPPNDPTPHTNNALYDYFPNIRFSHQDFVPRELNCEEDEFRAFENLIDGTITAVENSLIPLPPASLPYYVEVFNAMDIHFDCLETVTQIFPLESRTGIRGGLTCLYEVSDPEWNEDPCCNLELEVYQCCRFKTVPYETTARVYADQDEIVCNVEKECAESYFGDFLRSYNDQLDGVIGCPSLSTLEIERSYKILKHMELQSMRHCLSSSNIGGVDGAQFKGTQCNDDSDCVLNCNKDEGICQVGTSEEIETNFLRCWIETMGTVVEDYIRRRVFSSSEAKAPRFSEEFYLALKEHATELDCASTSHPLDFSQRTHNSLAQITNPEDVPICIGGDLCVYDHAPFGGSVIVVDDFLLLGVRVDSSENSCQSAAKCGGCLEEGACVSCFEMFQGRQEACSAQQAVGREDCEAKGTCIHPNGEAEHGVTKEECDAIQSQCSLCVYDVCTTWKHNADGTCFENVATMNQVDCEDVLGIWEASSSVCQIANANLTRAECEEPDFSWRTCGTYDFDECNSDTDLKSYLGCRWSSTSPSICSSQELCESGGRCSDEDLLFLLEEGGKGGCAWAGTVIELGNPPDILEAHVHYLPSLKGYMRASVRSEEECMGQSGLNHWYKEALTELECVGREGARWGCHLPDMRFTHAFFYEEEDCECLGGEYGLLAEWKTGEWLEPQFVPNTWNEEPKPPLYEWANVLSFERMAYWVTDTAQERSTAATVSALTCERNFTSSTLDWIICNCVSDGSPSECVVDSAPRVATARACRGLSMNMSAPSAHLFFEEDSISEGCVEVTLGFLSVDGFTYLRKRPSIAVQFDEPRTEGLVVNERGATVGSLLGDGLEINFVMEEFYSEGIDTVDHFEVCLNQHNRGKSTTELENGIVADFALLQSDGTLRVLYVDVNSVVNSGHLFWCGTIDNAHQLVKTRGSDHVSFTVFPVSRDDDASNKEIYSSRARIFAYVLAGCFLALLAFYTCLLVHNLFTFHTVLGVVVPMLFLLLCVFRAVFFLLWVEGDLEGNQVAEYILFETPTFLLLLLLLVLITCWKSISSKKEGKGVSVVREILFSVLVVLLYVGIVVASVVINDNVEEDESECPGRSPSTSTELEDAFNTLSICYMSVITFFTFLFAGVLFFEARIILRMVAKGFLMAIIYIPTSRFAFVFLIFFLIRCVLFLIVYAADITSDIFVFILIMLCEVIPCLILWVEVCLVAVSASELSSGGSGSSRRSGRDQSSVSMGSASNASGKM